MSQQWGNNSVQDRYNAKKTFGFIQSSNLRLKASDIRYYQNTWRPNLH